MAIGASMPSRGRAGAGRPADGGVFSSCWCDDVSPATPAREDSDKVAGIAAAAAVRGGMNP